MRWVFAKGETTERTERTETEGETTERGETTETEGETTETTQITPLFPPWAGGKTFVGPHGAGRNLDRNHNDPRKN